MLRPVSVRFRGRYTSCSLPSTPSRSRMSSSPTNGRREVTVTEVAAAARVSKATAARALGGYGAVSEAVRDRVLLAADELGYRPNALAKSMNTRRVGRRPGRRIRPHRVELRRGDGGGIRRHQRAPRQARRRHPGVTGLLD